MSDWTSWKREVTRVSVSPEVKAWRRARMAAAAAETRAALASVRAAWGSVSTGDMAVGVMPNQEVLAVSSPASLITESTTRQEDSETTAQEARP